MKKHYLKPEAVEAPLWEETILCVSSMNASHEGYASDDEEYNMFTQF